MIAQPLNIDQDDLEVHQDGEFGTTLKGNCAAKYGSACHQIRGCTNKRVEKPINVNAGGRAEIM